MPRLRWARRCACPPLTAPFRSRCRPARPAGGRFESAAAVSASEAVATATCSSPSRWRCRRSSAVRHARRSRSTRRRPARTTQGRASPPPCAAGRRVMAEPHVPDDAPVFVISVAAQLAGMHAQTLRQYDRLGLVTPGRTVGGGRRYSARDVALLREVQRLSQDEGVNLAGIKRIIELESHVDALQARVAELMAQLEQIYTEMDTARGPSTALMVWRPQRR